MLRDLRELQFERTAMSSLNWFEALSEARADAVNRSKLLLTYLHAPG